MIRSIDFNSYEKKHREYDVDDVYKKILSKKMTMFDPDTEEIWGFHDSVYVRFDKKPRAELSEYLYMQLRKKINADSSIESKIDGLIFLENAYSNFLDDSNYMKARNLIFNLIKEDIKNSDEITRDYINDCMVEFLSFSRKSIPDEIFVKPGSTNQMSIKSQKEMRRALFIADMIKEGVIDYDLLFKSGEILEFDFEQIDNAFRKKNAFTRDELIESLVVNRIFSGEDEVLDYYYKNDKKYFFEMANSTDLAMFLISGEFDSNDPKNLDRATAVRKMKIDEMAEFGPDLLESVLSIDNLPKNSFIVRNKGKSFINRDLMLKLRRNTLLKILYSKTIKYQNSLTSNDLVDMYGKLNFEDLKGLNQDKFINSEDIIKTIKFYNVDENQRELKQNLMDFYNLDKLEEMIKENRTNKKFMENFNTFSNEILSKEERKEYFERIKEDLKQRENKDELLIDLTRHGFDFGRIEGYQMSSEKVSDMYLSEEITEGEIFKLYSMGVVPLQVIREFFGSDEEIIKSYEEGNLDVSALSLVEGDAEFFKKELEEGRLTVKDIMELYALDGGLEIETLNEIFEGIDITQIGIGRSLPDTISAEKIEALFKSYYISQDELGELVGRGIITEAQADKYSKELDIHKEYENIFNSSRVVVLTKETEGERDYVPSQLGGTGGGTRKNQFKIDPDLQEELIEKIGFDDRRLVLEGYNNSLNGYTVYPSEEMGIMVFFNPNKPSNATYIMTIQQAMYFLKRSGIQNGKNTIESATTKQDLRETEHVKVRNACKGWGKNIIDTIKKLSPEMAKKIKDKKYKAQIDEIVEEIREDYDRRKE